MFDFLLCAYEYVSDVNVIAIGLFTVMHNMHCIIKSLSKKKERVCVFGKCINCCIEIQKFIHSHPPARINARPGNCTRETKKCWDLFYTIISIDERIRGDEKEHVNERLTTLREREREF